MVSSFYFPSSQIMEHPNSVQPSDQQGYPLGAYPAVTQQPAPYMQQSHHTTVVLNQQPVVIQKAQRSWSSGLCDCFQDCGSRKYFPKGT